MDNEFELTIEPVQSTDAGTYECTVKYSRSGPLTHRTTVNVVRGTACFYKYV